MKKITLPGTNVQITPLTFGAWAIGGWFWGGSDEKESLQAIECALDMGMTTIDTAPVYGFGQSEELVGKAIKGKKDKVQILTKFGLCWDRVSGHLHFEKTTDNKGNELSIYRVGKKDSIIKECEDSLRRLGIETIDLYQQHWPDNSTPAEETMEALEILKTEGKIRAGGVSNYNLNQFSEACKYFSLTSNQVPYSMVLRDIEKDLIPWCIKNNKAVIAYSPMQRGLLTGKITTGYHFNDGDHRPSTPFFREPNLSRINNFLSEIKPLADDKKATLAQLVLKWTLCQPGISCVLAGARNRDQVAENIKAEQIVLSEDDINFINEKLNNLQLEL
ncbi:MAG: aldo/keto reductase [Prolixibacteraceae bacterium]|nr:aldo/keto reductase [Prolixibacteraceae bacterium]